MGDMLNLIFIYSKEAVRELDDRLRDRKTYVGPDGKFKWSFTTKTTELVLAAMTGWEL